MSNQRWMETLIEAQSDGTALTASTTQTSIIPAAARYTLPSNYFNVIGKKIRIKAGGRISNIVTTPGTIQFFLTLGTIAAPINAFSMGTLQLNAVAKTNVTWRLDADFTVRAIGSGTNANGLGIGTFVSESVVGSPVPGTGGSGMLLLPASAPAVGTGFDSTITNVVDLQAQFSLNNANSVQVHDFSLESLN
jgi:hypothetical protein